MLPLHLAPSLLVTFMVALAVVPLAIIWMDERRNGAGAQRLALLRAEVRLRERLARNAQAEATPRPTVAMPQG